MPAPREYHIVVLGAGGVGKSCLTSRYVHDVWIESYDPTIEDSYRKQIEVDGRHVILEILDTAGTEQFTAMRELYLKSGKGFLLVFSITSPSSLRELVDLHAQLASTKNLSHNPGRIPLVLIGNKADLSDYRTVPPERALAVCRSWGDKPYYETSAKIPLNVEEVFTDLVRQIIRKDMLEMDEEVEEAEYKQRERESHGGGASLGSGGMMDGERRKRNREAVARYRKKKGRRKSTFGMGEAGRCVIL